MKDFLESFLGNLTIGQYLAFIVFTLVGMLLVKLVRYNLKKKRGLREDPPQLFKFSFRIWIDDNLLDFVTALMSAFIAFRFFPDALHFLSTIFPIGEFEEKMFYGFLLGVGFQYVVHRLMNNVKLGSTNK